MIDVFIEDIASLCELNNSLQNFFMITYVFLFKYINNEKKINDNFL